MKEAKRNSPCLVVKIIENTKPEQTGVFLDEASQERVLAGYRAGMKVRL